MDTRNDDSTKHMTMWFFFGMLFCFMVVESDAQLSENFYASTCPNVELIVEQAVTKNYQEFPITAPATLRLFFHDCFVGVCRLVCVLNFFIFYLVGIIKVVNVIMWSIGFIIQGCDASMLIASETGDAEKDAPDNLSLAGEGFATVIKAKQAVEAQCPGVVSCADILALAARDAMGLVSQMLLIFIYDSHTYTNDYAN